MLKKISKWNFHKSYRLLPEVSMIFRQNFSSSSVSRVRVCKSLTHFDLRYFPTKWDTVLTILLSGRGGKIWLLLTKMVHRLSAGRATRRQRRAGWGVRGGVAVWPAATQLPAWGTRLLLAPRLTSNVGQVVVGREVRHQQPWWRTRVVWRLTVIKIYS